MLVEERGKILEHLGRLEESSNSAIEELKGDSTDLASVEISQAALSKLGDRERKYLAKIDYALKKFEEGTYGVCELSGDQIPLKRLLARPVARYTVEAQEEIEAQEKRYRDVDDVEEEAYGEAE